MSFNTNSKLFFIDSLQFLRSSLDILVKNFGKDDFKYLGEKFDNKVLDLVQQKSEYFSEFECVSQRNVL